MGFGRDESALKILLRRPEGKMPLGRPRHRLENNVELVITQVGDGMDWILLAENRDPWTPMTMVLDLMIA